MTDIYVTVNDYGEVYLSSDVLGIKGENNARQLVFDAPIYNGADYEVWFDVGNENPYSARAVKNICVVPASVLSRETVNLQWVAVKGTQIMAKSQIFKMRVLESLDDDTLPVPTYEQAQTVLQQINSVIKSDGAKNDLFVKDNNTDSGAHWESLSELAKKASFAQTFILKWYKEPTKEQIEENLGIIKNYSNTAYPKNIILRIDSNGGKKYLSLSTVRISGSVFEFMFAGRDTALGAGVLCKKIIADIAKDTYSCYEDLGCNFFSNDEKAKLGTVSDGAQVNVIERIKVNGQAVGVSDKTVELTVPTAGDFCTRLEVEGIVNNAISQITDADGVNY